MPGSEGASRSGPTGGQARAEPSTSAGLSGQATRAGQPVQPGQSGRTGHAGHAGQSARPGQPGQSAPRAQSRQGDGEDQRASMWPRLAAVFALGGLAGWFVLGWWLFPVTWTDALPADLRTSARLEYVRMVAQLHAADGDLAQAQQRLASFHPITAEGPGDSLPSARDRHAAEEGRRRLAEALGVLAGPASDPEVARDAVRLARGLGITPIEPIADDLSSVHLGSNEGAAGAGPAGRPTDGQGDTGPATLRDAALSVTARIAAPFSVVGANGAGDGAERRWLMRAAAAAALLMGTLGIAWAVRARERSRSGEDLQRSAARDRGLGPGRRDAAQPDGVVPARLRLGQTVEVRFRTGDKPFVRSWLLYDERDRAVACADLEERRVGAANLLHVNFYEKLRSLTEGAGRQRLALVTNAATESRLVSHEHVRGRTVKPAVPSSLFSIPSGSFTLEVEVLDVSPDPDDAGALELRTARLALTAFRTTGGHPG